MEQSFFVPVVLPGWNQMNGGGVGVKIRAKKAAMEQVGLVINLAKLRPVKRAHFGYVWREPNRKRDPSNIAAGGRKVIEDALKRAGVISGDGWAVVAGFSDNFLVDKREPGVWVTITDAD